MIIGKFLIFKPREVFGNKCEQLLYALLMCRRKKLKLVIIKRKFDGFSLFKYRRSNKEVLNIKHELVLNNILIESISYLISFLLLFFNFLYNLLSYIKIPRKINFFYNIAVFTSGTKFLYGKIKGKYHKNKMSINWSDEYENKLNVSYRSRNTLESEFPELKDKKYVCLHVRTSGFGANFVGYKKEKDDKDVRNIEISSYKLAIKELTSSGFIVVRIGDPSMEQIEMDNVIDYANDARWSEKNDIILVEHCDYYIGSPSGPADLACLFEKKILIVNHTNLSVNLTYRSGSLFLPKKVLVDNSQLELKDSIERYIFGGGGGIIGNFDEEKIDFLDNTPLEIHEAVKEFINFDFLTKEQLSYNSFFKDKFEECIDLIETDDQNVEIDKGRWHARLLGNKGSISQSFLSSSLW
jgi:putative glycosyltransferase (TIGR04372 family)